MSIEKRRQAKRAELLKAATDQFLLHGYEGVSVDAVIAKAGGTKTNIYILFGGKARLFQAVVNDLCEGLAGRFGDLKLSSLPLEEGLRTFGRAYLATLLGKHAVRQHRLMVAEAARFPALGKRWLKAEHEAAEQFLVRYLETLPRTQLTVPPRLLTRLFLSGLRGDLLARQLFTGAAPPSERDIVSYVNEVLSIVLHGVSNA